MATVKQLEATVNSLVESVAAIAASVGADTANRPAKAKAKAKAKPKGKSDSTLDALMVEAYDHIEASGKVTPKVTANSASFWVKSSDGDYYITVGKMHTAD